MQRFIAALAAIATLAGGCAYDPEEGKGRAGDDTGIEINVEINVEGDDNDQNVEGGDALPCEGITLSLGNVQFGTLVEGDPSARETVVVRYDCADPAQRAAQDITCTASGDFDVTGVGTFTLAVNGSSHNVDVELPTDVVGEFSGRIECTATSGWSGVVSLAGTVICTDTDGDRVCDDSDICPDGNDRIDSDGDGVPNACDDCDGDDTMDSDGDRIPDACDECPDDNPDDTDGDGVCDSFDECPGFDDLTDSDRDGTPDCLDPCPDDNPDDTDGDGVCDSDDICPDGNDGVDVDGDGIPNDCDDCFGFDDDSDGDGICDDADPCPDDPDDDSDGDFVCDSDDLCPGLDDRIDTDGDGTPDCLDIEDTGIIDTGAPADPCDLFGGDTDGDGVCDDSDACPDADDAIDSDGDTVPDGCDLCEGHDDSIETDGDGIPDGCDECWGDNATGDSDGDGVCDDADPCDFDDPDDSDFDGVCDSDDACPGFDDGLDTDEDGIPDDCDECPDGGDPTDLWYPDADDDGRAEYTPDPVMGCEAPIGFVPADNVAPWGVGLGGDGVNDWDCDLATDRIHVNGEGHLCVGFNPDNCSPNPDDVDADGDGRYEVTTEEWSRNPASWPTGAANLCEGYGVLAAGEVVDFYCPAIPAEVLRGFAHQVRTSWPTRCD